MTERMKPRVLPVMVAFGSSLLLFGCPSKDASSSNVAASPSTATAATATSAEREVESGTTASGPLASLESTPAVDETWTSQEGVSMPFVFFAAQNVRVSAQCRQPNGQLECDAIRQLRSSPVDIPKASLTGGISAGTRVCMALKHRLVTGQNAEGTEDGFCRFPDGSMVSTGALEQHAMRIVD